MSSIPPSTEDKKDEGKVLPGGKKIINGIVYDADGKPYVLLLRQLALSQPAHLLYERSKQEANATT
jgi:hypothetical protein